MYWMEAAVLSACVAQLIDEDYYDRVEVTPQGVYWPRRKAKKRYEEVNVIQIPFNIFRDILVD